MITTICDLPEMLTPVGTVAGIANAKLYCFRVNVRSHWIGSSIGSATFLFIEFHHGIWYPPIFGLLKVFLKYFIKFPQKS